MQVVSLLRKRFRSMNQKDVEHSLYWMSLIILPVVLLVYFAVYRISLLTGLKTMTQCMLKTMTGIPCPGCGGTRAVECLFRGEIFSSIYYNAFATYSVIVYLLFFITQTLQRITKGRIKGMKYRNGYIYAAILILGVQYLLKIFVPCYRI